ncbi:MBL fold metallo-hydrolase [Aldersonia sp. NBC_00410]|uniref:MBL fold metallo-hydrolase n=1 Tax=Aldersonia sp. NBC_00410 TaxID=2975954 RepID=UPI00225808D4|nr:MBL fold metallo-hydrolase [Aldersonia sp. NBC_00410]MCX5043194.1 MBL fold metallo-hydrolase [Aldersonia sp. NBC_00410]
MDIHRLRNDVTVLADQTEIPGLGHLPVNAFVLHADQPVVIDTGLSLPDRDFVTTLSSVIDPVDVKWIWLTHPDRDHTGGLYELLDAAPNARVITTFLGMGILASQNPLPLERVYLLNPGQSIDVGDRSLTAFRPPVFDSPATTGLFDTRTGVCLSSDCFGAVLETPEHAAVADLADAPESELKARQLLWAGVDSPWVHNVHPDRFAAMLSELRRLDPSWILSSHLPPTRSVDTLFTNLLDAPQSDPFVGPDQAALEAMLAEFEPVPA